MASHRRGPWSQAEDGYLMSLVANQGALNWVRIAQLLGSRTPKQCRERYHQNLKPTLNHDPITPEEGAEIERLVLQVGKRWAEIARRLHGRSDNAVKNWWNGSQNRRKRMDRRKHIPGSFEDHQEMSYSRPTVQNVPRSLPSLPPLPTRHLPQPLSTDYANRAYCFETPLPSPVNAHSPGGDSEMTPSLASDGGSCYSTSPRSSAVPCSPVELPPLKNIDVSGRSPRFSTSSTESTRLPGLSSLTSPIFQKQEMSHSLPPMMSMGENVSPRTHLLTAPNSPAQGLPSLRVSQPQGLSQYQIEANSRSRMDLAKLLI